MAMSSYAQCGQDILAQFLLRRSGTIPDWKSHKGRYVDIGSNDPVRGSNTYAFYKIGWSGLCIDANPDLADNFRKLRPNDTVLSCGVGKEEGTLQFYRFTTAQHNTFDPGRARKNPDKVHSVIDVPVRTLTSILDEHLGDDRRIDLLSIDAENYELNILSSTDFGRYRPTLIVFESFGSIRQGLERPEVRLLEQAGYELVANTGHDIFMIDRKP
ncbi:FkbM family methyltransferase [Roseomonas sp. SSH11]|uniref:FkbM family methyltransferase n=1 Tax=Pararoseomonas baculiformis TaxID=2820812 RepID=A0ABS4ADG5_9PROT|nr:FkbM family methyltransferase [Pararoseomonas baculiformis]MBP0445054.1 FkbM family methyltransferase [Pararoseomonas baculiformis]